MLELSLLANRFRVVGFIYRAILKVVTFENVPGIGCSWSFDLLLVGVLLF